MDKELVEEVARGLLAERVEQTDESWVRYRQPESWKLFTGDAKAALQAIQSSGTFMVVPVEPTEAMLSAVFDGWNQSDPLASHKTIAANMCKAMLDACK